MSDNPDQFTVGAGGHLRGERFSFLFERGEFDLDEFVIVQRLLDAGHERVGQSRLTEMQDGIEPLRQHFQFAKLWIGQAHLRTTVDCFRVAATQNPQPNKTALSVWDGKVQ